MLFLGECLSCTVAHLVNVCCDRNYCVWGERTLIELLILAARTASTLVDTIGCSRLDDFYWRLNDLLLVLGLKGTLVCVYE